jgi:hypothetical protein
MQRGLVSVEAGASARRGREEERSSTSESLGSVVTIRRQSAGPSTGTGMPRRLCLALMALTQCFKTEIVNSQNVSAHG